VPAAVVCVFCNRVSGELRQCNCGIGEDSEVWGQSCEGWSSGAWEGKVRYARVQGLASCAALGRT